MPVLFECVEAYKIFYGALWNEYAFNTIASVKCCGLNALN